MLHSIDYNSLTLAYLGDAIYEVYIRNYLIQKGIIKVNNLQHEAIKYVSANSQRKILENLINNNYLTDTEMIVMNRARNHKGTRHPKSTDIVTYKYATALEAIFGYLYLENNLKRIEEIINFVVKED